MTRRRALVTGVAGQDGSYLAELLLERDYELHGLVRAPVERRLPNLEHIREHIALLPGDLRDPASLRAALEQVHPHELYHLAAPSFVPDAWKDPGDTLLQIAVATADLLTAARELDPAIRVYVASSGEIFGDADESPQTETTPCRPTTPYGVAKVAAHMLTGTLRAHDGLHACSGITYNHESPRRPERFISRKVTRAAAAIKLGLQSELALGDLDAQRDWCFAGDVVRGAWLALQADTPDDYVFASGVARSVRELVEVAFACVGVDPEPYVRVDPAFVRAPERTPRVGDATKARELLGWKPEIAFEEMIATMVEADLRELGERPAAG